MSRRVRRTIRRHALVADGDRVAVALSAGSDSIALACLLVDLAGTQRGWQIAGLIHVNHGLRAHESDGDEMFCRAFAERLGLSIHVQGVDVVTHARERRQSIESAARQLRYGAFETGAARLGATLVATGHTQDDQAETVLLRLLRGAGSRGVSAIRPRRGRYIRPLLDSRRVDLRAYLADRGEPFRDDSSNLDVAIPRNRIRHAVLPVIAEHWPGAVPALARFAELAAADEAFLARTAAEITPALTLPAPDGVQQIDTRGLNQLPAPLARRIVRRAIEQSGGTPAFRDVEAVRALARADNLERHLDLKGSVVERDGPRLTFMGRRPADANIRAFEYPLAIPGMVTIAETGSVLRASLITGASQRPASADGLETAVFQADTVEGPLTVRNRRPGDRLKPFGAPGSRKLQDVLVDRKIPRGRRDLVPLVVDRNGRILWVVGLTIADEARVLRPESGMVVLESTKGNQ